MVNSINVIQIRFDTEPRLFSLTEKGNTLKRLFSKFGLLKCNINSASIKHSHIQQPWNRIRPLMKKGSNRPRMKEDLLRWMNMFSEARDAKKTGQWKLFPQVPCFPPAFIKSHTGFCSAHEARLASTQHLFFFPDCNGTLRLFKVTGQKVSGWGQQTNFFWRGSVRDFKRPV